MIFIDPSTNGVEECLSFSHKILII